MFDQAFGLLGFSGFGCLWAAVVAEIVEVASSIRILGFSGFGYWWAAVVVEIVK